MSTHRLAALGSVVLTVAAFAAAPPPRPLGTAEMQALIEKLADRDYRVREQAERRLVAEGFPALPLLRKAMGHKDPEVRRRALRLVPGLEHAALVAPKRITATIKSQSLRTICEEISKQSGYQIQHQGVMMGGGPGVVFAAPVAIAVPAIVKGKGKAAAPATPSEPTFSYTWVNQPFWDVIDKLCKDHNLVIQQGYGDEVVRLYNGSGTSQHVGRDGAFSFAASNMKLYRRLDLY